MQCHRKRHFMMGYSLREALFWDTLKYPLEAPKLPWASFELENSSLFRCVWLNALLSGAVHLWQELSQHPAKLPSAIVKGDDRERQLSKGGRGETKGKRQGGEMGGSPSGQKSRGQPDVRMKGWGPHGWEGGGWRGPGRTFLAGEGAEGCQQSKPE